MYHTPASSATTKTKPVAVNFTGGKLTSDAGALLLKLADQKLRFTQPSTPSLDGEILAERNAETQRVRKQ